MTANKPHAPDAYATDRLVSDVMALLDHAGCARADLFGYSMGARLALHVALTHPERIVDLIVGGIGGRLFEPRATETMRMSDALLAEDPSSITEPMLRSFRHFADEQGEDRNALAACAQSPITPLARDDLAGIRARCLVVAGARDSLAGDPHELASAIPGAVAKVLPGCDHSSAIPHGLLKAAVFDFLDGEL